MPKTGTISEGRRRRRKKRPFLFSIKCLVSKRKGVKKENRWDDSLYSFCTSYSNLKKKELDFYLHMLFITTSTAVSLFAPHPIRLSTGWGSLGGPMRERAKVESSLRPLSRWPPRKSINWAWLNRPFFFFLLFSSAQFFPSILPIHKKKIDRGSSWRMV